MRSRTFRPARSASTTSPSISSAVRSSRGAPSANRSCVGCGRCLCRVDGWPSTCSPTFACSPALLASRRFSTSVSSAAWAATSWCTPNGVASLSQTQHLGGRTRLFGMPLILFIVVAVLLCWLFFALTFSLIGLLITLLVAGVVGWLADLVVPGRLPGGWLGAVLTGLIGGFIGGAIFHAMHWNTGLRMAGVELIPAFVGAVIVAFVAQALTVRRTASY